MKVTFTFRFRRWSPALAAALAAGTIYGCASTAPVPVVPSDEKWASERWPGTTLSDLSHGHDVFISRCSSCHSLPRPDVKSPEEWNTVLDEMADRAKLSTNDRELVNRYLSAASQRLRARTSATGIAANSPTL
jgi:hypothetical protein